MSVTRSASGVRAGSLTYTSHGSPSRSMPYAASQAAIFRCVAASPAYGPLWVARMAGPGSDREAKGAVQHEVEMFAKKIGDYLDKARTAHRFDRLHLVAPPKFLGQLRKALGKEVQKRIEQELPKDLSWIDARDLEQKFFGK